MQVCGYWLPPLGFGAPGCRRKHRYALKVHRLKVCWVIILVIETFRAAL